MIDTRLQEQQAALALNEANTMSRQILAYRVTSPETAQQAADVTRQLRDKRKGLEGQRDEMAKPLRKIATKISALFKRPIDQLTQCESHLKLQISGWQATEAAKVQAQLSEARTHEEVQETIAAVAVAPAGTHQRETWGWEFTGQPIPAEYYLLDTKRLDREAKAMKAGLSVPGVRPVRGNQTIVK